MKVPIRHRIGHLTYLFSEFPGDTILVLLGTLGLAAPFFLAGWYLATRGGFISLGIVLPFGGVIVLWDVVRQVGAPHPLNSPKLRQLQQRYQR